MNKILKFVSVILAVFMLLGTNVRSSSSAFSVEQIRLDNLDISNGDVVYVERGTTSTLEVWVKGQNVTVDNVKIKAWIGGYEYGDIQDTSDIFDVEAGTTYKKTLRLDIPTDFEVSNTDSMNVEVYNGDESVRQEFTVKIREQRHYLSIMDVNLNPGLTVEAGKNLFGTVRVENLGAKDERDVKVTMSIPELGLTASTYIDRLFSESTDCDITSCETDNKVSTSSDEIYFKIPENTKEGTYTLKVQVSYNRGYTTEEKTYALNVKSGVPSLTSNGALVSVDSNTQTAQAGKGAVFKVSVTNLAGKTMTFSTDVAGVSSWGTSRTDPATVTVAADQTAEMFVYVSANEDAQAVDHSITLTVKSGDAIVKQVPVTVKVSSASSDTTFGSLRRGLEIGFIVLLIVLVILGLILAARKLGGKDEEESGKTYY
jgi:uncharacterized membrane protein